MFEETYHGILINNNNHKVYFLPTTDPLHLVKTKSKRRVVSRDDSLSSMYLCKLCNSYVDKSLMKQHNRKVIIGFSSQRKKRKE